MKTYGIAGSAYSGSSLLSFMLGVNDNIFSVGEFNHILFKKNLGRNSLCNVHKNKCNFFTKDDFKNIMSINDPKQKIKYYYDKISNSGKEIVVNSMKNMKYFHKMVELNEKIDGIIILLKSPLRFYSSLKGHGEPFTLKRALHLYTNNYNYILNFCREHKIPFICLTYEKMITNTEVELKKICEFIGVEYDEKMLSPFEHKDSLHTFGGNTGTYLNVWDKTEEKLKSDYWKEKYSVHHTKFAKENKGKIMLDDRWKMILTDEEKNIIINDKKVNEFYEKFSDNFFDNFLSNNIDPCC